MQVHGYDLTAIVCSPSAPHLYFSGGDEKVLRVFEAPQVVLSGLSKLCVDAEGSPLTAGSGGGGGDGKIQRAFIPALGLSNKAADLMNSSELEEQEARHVQDMDWTTPPLEGQLADHTLWPETRKLFGHTGDVMCMAIAHSGAVLASACKGRNPETSSIIIWDTGLMKQVGSIMAHESTVVCIRFSPSDRYIMSVSKDRGLCISELSSDGAYHPILLHKNAHKRIIWDCSWCGDSTIVTGSRDGVCKVWALSQTAGAGADADADADDTAQLSLDIIFEFRPFEGAAVTTVDIAPVRLSNGAYLLACGAESGDIKMWSILDEVTAASADNIVGPTLVSVVDKTYCHGLAIKRLRWSPANKGEGEALTPGEKLYFATCGEDKCVRIFSTQLSSH
jgi:elongator complex protein 2